MGDAYKNTAGFESKTASFKKLLVSSWSSLRHKTHSPRHSETRWPDHQQLAHLEVRPRHAAQSFDMLVESDVITGTHAMV